MKPYNEIVKSPLVNENECKFVRKIFEDNDIFNESKLSTEKFVDPLAKTIFSIAGDTISRLGEFKPLIHLKPLCEDDTRLKKFNSLGYPFTMTTPDSIVEYFKLFSDKSIKHQTIELFIEDEYIKRKLVTLSDKIIEDVENSKVNIRKSLIKTSVTVDNLLYSAEEEVVVKDTEELVDDFIAYLGNPNVEAYVKTGVDIIDSVSGGTPNQAFISWVAPAKAGKSTMLVDSAVDNLKRGRHCIFFSIEMSEQQVYQRMIANYAGFPYEKIAKKELTKDELEYLVEKSKEFKDRYKDQFEIYQNRSGICVKNIEAHIARRRRAGMLVHDIFVDYLQILVQPTKVGNKTEAMEELVKQCRQLVQKMQLRLFLPAQLNSSARDLPISDITDFHISWAKSLAREVDVLLVLLKHKDLGIHQIKFILARINHTDDTYFLPDADLNLMRFGRSIPWDEALAEKISEERGLAPNTAKKKGKSGGGFGGEEVSDDWF